MSEELQLNGLMEQMTYDGTMMEQMTHDGNRKKEMPALIKLETKEQITREAKSHKSEQIRSNKDNYKGPFIDKLEEVAKQVNGLIERSDKMVEIGKNPKDGQIMFKRALICQLCGKEGSDNNIRNHIEVKHLEGITLPCRWCQKTFKTRKSLRRHKGSHAQRNTDQNPEEIFKTWKTLRTTAMPMLLPKKE